MDSENRKRKGVRGRERQTKKEGEKTARGKIQNHAKRQQSSMLVRWHSSIEKTDSEKLRNHLYNLSIRPK